jgi:hypothetical protein
MMDLVVFAQGADVRVNSIVGANIYHPVETVNVRYSEQASTAPRYVNNPSVIISRELVGVVATFRNIPIGSYSLDVTGARTVEIYYSPDVEIGVFLTDGSNQEITADRLEAGEYTLNFTFIDRGSRGRGCWAILRIPHPWYPMASCMTGHSHMATG